jgi:mRNA interferase RelE/StbE
MTYKLEFKKSALKEWKKLGHIIKEQFKKKLRERLENPHVPSAGLSGAKNIQNQVAPTRISTRILC